VKAAIQVNGLERSFGKHTVLNGLSFDVPAGSVTGLLGPNAAGKSTTIHILMGILRRHGGDVSVLGYDPAVNDVAIRQRTGFVPEDPRGEPLYTVRQNLDFLKAFRPGWDASLEQDLLKRFDLDPAKMSRTLSRGERAKLGLIGALSFRPELLILDDPTSGLDPLARREFIEGVVGVLADEGRTVFFSTHQVDDIERVADRIVVLHKGQNLYSAEMETIHDQWRCYRISFADKEAPAVLSPSLPGLRTWTPEGRSGVALFDTFTDLSEKALANVSARVDRLPFSLEDIYVELARTDTGGNIS
jgi:ABC-2 type transport system ATP-binding protein